MLYSLFIPRKMRSATDRLIPTQFCLYSKTLSYMFMKFKFQLLLNALKLLKPVTIRGRVSVLNHTKQVENVLSLVEKTWYFWGQRFSAPVVCSQPGKKNHIRFTTLTKNPGTSCFLFQRRRYF